jgi:adenylate kinase
MIQAKKRLVLILLGPPGSGKGTQAARISRESGVPHISTGELFREHLRQKSPLGERVRGYMDAGQLVPDALVLDMLFDRLAQGDCEKGFLLDGFPRTLAQAEELTNRLKGDKVVVVDLGVSDDVILKRMSGRLTCKQCGRVYNRFFSPPKSAEGCDACGGELYQRSDDAESIVKDRLAVYHNQTKPLIAYYEAQDKLHHIDGEQSPEIIFEKIVKVVR